MKKKINFVLPFLCSFLTFGVLSCSDNSEPSHETQVYSVSCEKSDYYTYGGTVNSTSGTKAEFKITSNFPAYEIVGCTFNGTECDIVSSDDDGKKFSFTMPDSNVEIKVLGKWNDLAASGPRNFLSFDENNIYTAQSAVGDGDYNNDQNLGTPLVLLFNTNAGLMTIADMTCISANEEVLPSSAIEVIKTTASSSNNIVGGKIIIDRSKAKVGTTQIVLHVKSGNSMGDNAIIVATITITE